MVRTAFAAGLLAASASLASAGEPIRAIPHAMIGTWGYEARSCTDDTDDGRVEVTARSVTFFATSCSLTRFHAEGDGAITGRGRCRGEGETTSERGSVRLRIEGRNRLVIALDGREGMAYLRCARPIPVR
jgi:hypothetical protein